MRLGEGPLHETLPSVSHSVRTWRADPRVRPRARASRGAASFAAASATLAAGVLLPGLLNLLRALLVQPAQIYFQPTPAAGAAIVAALAVVRPWAAVGMLGAGALAWLAARLLRLDRARADAGLLGFNAALTGAGLLSLFDPGPRVFAYLAAVAVTSALVCDRWLRRPRVPPLTFPFVIAMLGAVALGDRLGPAITPLGCDDGPVGLVPCGVGQVAFVAGALPGLAVWLAIAARAPLQALWLAFGAALGGLGGLAFAGSQAVGLAVNLGLVALGLTVTDRGVIARLIGMTIAATLCMLAAAVGLPYFTLPFVLATWALLLATRPRGE